MKKSFILFITSMMLVAMLIPTNMAEAATNAQLQKEIKALKSTITKKNKEIKTLKSTATKKNKEIKTLKSKVKTQANQITSLKKKVPTATKTLVLYQNKTLKNSVIKYNGTDYIPVNKVSNLIGLGNTYVKKENKWYIGENSSGKMMSDFLRPYVGYGSANPEEGITMAGITYSKGYEFAIGYDPGEVNKALFNLQGKYSKITGKLGFVDDSSYNYVVIHKVKVGFYGDGKLLKSYTLSRGDIPTSVSIPVKGVKKLEVRSTLLGDDYPYDGPLGLVNPKIY